MNTKISWWKSNKTVKNPAQAGDAALAFYFGGNDSCVLEINTQERFPIDDKYFHGKYELSLWGVSKGLKKIPLLQTGTFSDSLEALKFTEEEISLYTHFVLFGVLVSTDEKVDGKSSVKIYHMDSLDRNQIVTGYF